jgi:hypothetical protein
MPDLEKKTGPVSRPNSIRMHDNTRRTLIVKQLFDRIELHEAPVDVRINGQPRQQPPPVLDYAPDPQGKRGADGHTFETALAPFPLVCLPPPCRCAGFTIAGLEWNQIRTYPSRLDSCSVFARWFAC